MSFSCRLVNPIHADPALLVEIPNRSHRWLFDCGDLHPLSLAELLSIDTLFVSHGHIDHWIGFDAILRAQLFCEQTLRVIGPAGLLSILQARLQGYAWNLVADSRFVVEGYEWQNDRWRARRFECCRGFDPQDLEPGLPDLEGWSLRWQALNHGVPCLGYRLEEPRRWRFRIEDSPAPPGPWVEQLKQSIRANSGEQLFEVGGHQRAAESLWRLLEELPSQSLAYVTDTRLDPGLRSQIVEKFGPTDTLWCEAAFLTSQQDLAESKRHATACEAASLALELPCKRLQLFHLSRRSQGDPGEHLLEARKIFPATFAEQIHTP